ncbi:MAG: DUF4870 domain-containing protein [Bacteroidales bacterium]|nr:DUF4870 domain-containing protein [Bacteroidales bacterium]MDD4821813.1 DUF4870 domain-containing protein [Bacteroidales bacterium]
MNYKRLEELNNLRQSGALTEEEFQREKQKLFEQQDSAGNSGIPFDLSESAYLGLMNFVFLVPTVGWILSIIAWVIGKDKSAKIDEQGKNIVNFMISYALYGLIFFCSILMVIGIVLIPAAVVVGVLVIVFPIIAGIKGLNGETWRYPLTIEFLR